MSVSQRHSYPVARPAFNGSTWQAHETSNSPPAEDFNSILPNLVPSARGKGYGQHVCNQSHTGPQKPQHNPHTVGVKNTTARWASNQANPRHSAMWAYPSLHH